MFGNLGMKLINVHVTILQPYVDGFIYHFYMQEYPILVCSCLCGYAIFGSVCLTENKRLKVLLVDLCERKTLLAG
jgi:hypothetical protein